MPPTPSPMRDAHTRSLTIEGSASEFMAAGAASKAARVALDDAEMELSVAITEWRRGGD